MDKYKNFMDLAFEAYVTDEEWNNFFGRVPKFRYETMKYCLKKFTEDNLSRIVELGTSRSFVDGRWEGCNSSDTSFWEPLSPKKWDWSAGCFTRVVGEFIQDKNATLSTVDLQASHIERSKHMTQDLKNISYHVSDSKDFLRNFADKIDFLYLDTGDVTPVEPVARLHLEEAQIVIERDLMSSKGLILIDDVRNVACKKQNKGVSDYGKAKYSIPYFCKNGWKIVLDEYQVVLERK